MPNLMAPTSEERARQESADEDECIRRLATQYEERCLVKRFRAGRETELDRIHRQIEQTLAYHLYLDELIATCEKPPTEEERIQAEANARTAANIDDWRKYRRAERSARPALKPIRLVGERAYGTFASALLHSSQSSGRLRAVLAAKCTIPATPVPEVLADEETHLLPATRAELEQESWVR